MCGLKTVKIRFFIPAGGAAATPPFGPILGQYGVNTVQFCKDFNAATDGLLFFFDDNLDESSEFFLTVDIYIYEDRTYKYIIHKPSTSFLLRLLSGVKRGAPNSNVGVISSKELLFLAQFKFPELSLFSACKIIMGSARSIGISVSD